MTTLRTPPESKLGIKLQNYRSDRPDEWIMDEFTREAEAMNEQNKSLRAALSKIAGIESSCTSLAMEYPIAKKIADKALKQTK